MNICYALIVEIDGKLDTTELFCNRNIAYEKMQQDYFKMRENISCMFSSIDSSNAIIVNQNARCIKWSIKKMEIKG